MTKLSDTKRKTQLLKGHFEPNLNAHWTGTGVSQRFLIFLYEFNNLILNQPMIALPVEMLYEKIHITGCNR